MTIPPPSKDWNVHTLKEYTDGRFEAADKAVLAALDAAEKGLNKVASGTDKRFDELSDKIDKIQESVSSATGGQTSNQRLMAIALPTIMSAGAIITVILVHKP